MSALIEAFLAEKLAQDRFTESTKRAARVSLNMLAEFVGGLPVTAITTTRLQSWFDGKRAESSEATAQTHLARARSFFKWCTKKQLIARNPCDGVTVGRVSRRGQSRTVGG